MLTTNSRRPDEEYQRKSGNLSLHVEHYRPAGLGRLNLVAVHGFTQYTGIFHHVATEFAAHGMAVTLFDCRGHGRSEGRRGHVDRFDDYLCDLNLVVTEAVARYPELPLALLGHSLGGAIVLSYATQDALLPLPSFVVASAPWLALRMNVSMPKRAAAEVFARLRPTLSINNGLKAEDVSRNPVVVSLFGKDPLVHHVATAGWFSSVLRAQAQLRANASKLRIPTLMLLAGEDKIVSTDASLAFAREAGPAVETRRYDALYHELLLEPERDQVITDIAEWLMRSAVDSGASQNAEAL